MRITAEFSLYSDTLIFFGGSDGESDGGKLKYGAGIRWNSLNFFYASHKNQKCSDLQMAIGLCRGQTVPLQNISKQSLSYHVS